MPQYFSKATISSKPGKGLGPYYTEDEWAEVVVRIEALENIVREAIEWDGFDADGIPAVWLERAEMLLAAKRISVGIVFS